LTSVHILEFESPNAFGGLGSLSAPPAPIAAIGARGPTSKGEGEERKGKEEGKEKGK